jgi:hypothetical protein
MVLVVWLLLEHKDTGRKKDLKGNIKHERVGYLFGKEVSGSSLGQGLFIQDIKIVQCSTLYARGLRVGEMP